MSEYTGFVLTCRGMGSSRLNLPTARYAQMNASLSFNSAIMKEMIRIFAANLLTDTPGHITDDDDDDGNDDSDDSNFHMDNRKISTN